jgi:hypothetical protein
VNALFQAALEAQRFIQKREWPFCIIGGMAVIRWGQPRATQDVDISLLAGFGREEEFIDILLEQFAPRIGDARAFALESRTVLCQAANAVALDIILAGFPFEEQVIARASTFAFAQDAVLMTASAEDLIVLKAFAGRDQDWADVRGIVVRQAQLDWKQILLDLKDLCSVAGDNEPLAKLEKIRSAADDGTN